MSFKITDNFLNKTPDEISNLYTNLRIEIDQLGLKIKSPLYVYNREEVDKYINMINKSIELLMFSKYLEETNQEKVSSYMIGKTIEELFSKKDRTFYLYLYTGLCIVFCIGTSYFYF